jgi:hypothetical protein
LLLIKLYYYCSIDNVPMRITCYSVLVYLILGFIMILVTCYQETSGVTAAMNFNKNLLCSNNFQPLTAELTLQFSHATLLNFSRLNF